MGDETQNFLTSNESDIDQKKWLAGVDMPVFIISGGAIVLFVILTLYDIDMMSGWVNSAFATSTKYFGAYWQVLLLLTFVIGIILAVGRTGAVVLGGIKAPEMPTFQWRSIIMCTLLAGGGVLWAAAEQMAPFTAPTPLFVGETGTAEAACLSLTLRRRCSRSTVL